MAKGFQPKRVAQIYGLSDLNKMNELIKSYSKIANDRIYLLEKNVRKLSQTEYIAMEETISNAFQNLKTLAASANVAPSERDRRPGRKKEHTYPRFSSAKATSIQEASKRLDALIRAVNYDRYSITSYKKTLNINKEWLRSEIFGEAPKSGKDTRPTISTAEYVRYWDLVSELEGHGYSSDAAQTITSREYEKPHFKTADEFVSWMTDGVRSSADRLEREARYYRLRRQGEEYIDD